MKQHLETLTIAGGLGVLAYIGYKILKGKPQSDDAQAGLNAITARNATRTNLTDPEAYYLANGGRNPSMALDRWDGLQISYSNTNGTRP